MKGTMMSLSILVSQDKWQDFDSAWTDLMGQEDESVDDLVAALQLVGEKKRMPRCLPLVKEHVALLEAGDRHADAARVLGAALRGGAAGHELADTLYHDAKEAWGGEPWWERFTELAGFLPDAPDVRKAWMAFERLRSFQPGTLVYHPGGWGTGEVLELRQKDGEVVVRFQSGRQDVFPLSGAVDIFEPLPEDDLRAVYFRDPDGMKKRLKNEPLDMLRAVLGRYYGRATLIQIRNALMQVGVEGSGWTAWWRKARKLAMNSPWFKVTGTPQRGEVQLLLSEGDPAADLRRELETTADLGETLKQVRGTLGSEVDPALRQVAIESLEREAAEESARPADRLAAWLVLRDETGEASEGLAEALRGMAALPAPEDPAEAPVLWAMLGRLGTAKEQEKAVGVLKEVLGEGWLDECLRHLQHAPPGAVRPIVDAAVSAKRKPELVAHYADLLSRPMRSPHVLVALARYVERWKPKEGLPTGPQRAQALVSLASYLYLNRRGNPALVRVFNRLTEMLARGDNALLPKLLHDADRESLASVYRIAQRGVDEPIDLMVSDLALRSIQELAGHEPTYFWNNDRIWTTRHGLEKRRAELRDLIEVKIPANTEAIGRAAQMGDLSENAEWDAAIEEQGNLSRKAAAMEEELGRIDLIEEAALPEDTICPGTVVHYREPTTGKERKIEILGPWDTDRGDQVVSYRAPLAEALLGLHPGDKARVQLPSGELEVEVVGVEPMSFG